MKAKTLKLWMCLGLMSLGLLGCDNKDLPLVPECIEARVVAHVCGHTVVQIISPEYAHLGQDSWADGEGQNYENVFYTRINCSQVGLVPINGESFHFKVATEPQDPGNCIVCAAILANPPQVSIEMVVVYGCGETNS